MPGLNHSHESLDQYSESSEEENAQVTEQTPREEESGQESKQSHVTINKPNEDSSADKKLAREAIVKVAAESQDFGKQTNLNSVDEPESQGHTVHNSNVKHIKEEHQTQVDI